MKWIAATVVALAGLAVVVVVVLGATGPKYALDCPHNYVLADAADYRWATSSVYDQPSGRVCIGRYAGDQIGNGDWTATRIKRLGLFERAWYNLTGSRDTRG